MVTLGTKYQIDNYKVFWAVSARMSGKGHKASCGHNTQHWLVISLIHIVTKKYVMTHGCTGGRGVKYLW